MPIYRILRIICCLLLLAAGMVFILKSRVRRKRFGMILLAVSVVVVYLLSLVIPLEDAVLTFPSIEEAFHYKSEEQIGMTVEGNESAMVVIQSSGNEGNHFFILPKKGNRWQSFMELDKKIVDIRPWIPT